MRAGAVSAAGFVCVPFRHAEGLLIDYEDDKEDADDFRSLMIGLDLDEIESLLLAKGRSGLAGGLPVRNCQGGGGGFRVKDFPMISDTDGSFGLGVGRVHFGK